MYFCTYLNLCFCHVFLTNKAFVTFQEFKNNQECKPKTNFHYHNFWWMIKFVFCYVLKSEIYVIHKKRSSILREKRIRNPPISSIQVWEMLQKHIHVPKPTMIDVSEILLGFNLFLAAFIWLMYTVLNPYHRCKISRIPHCCLIDCSQNSHFSFLYSHS